MPIELFDALAETHALDERDGRLWRFTRFRGWQLVKAVMRDASIAEGPHMTPKGLRHSFGIHAIRSGVPLNLVQRWLGHASMGNDRDLPGCLGRGRARDRSAHVGDGACTYAITPLD